MSHTRSKAPSAELLTVVQARARQRVAQKINCDPNWHSEVRPENASGVGEQILSILDVLTVTQFF